MLGLSVLLSSPGSGCRSPRLLGPGLMSDKRPWQGRESWQIHPLSSTSVSISVMRFNHLKIQCIGMTLIICVSAEKQQRFRLFRVWAMISLSFGVPLASVNNFLPQIVASLGYSTVRTNLLTVAPNIVGTVALLLLTFSSDHFRERSFHMYVDVISKSNRPSLSEF